MRAILLPASVLIFLAQLVAQRGSVEPPAVPAILQAMNSSNMGERERAFDDASTLLSSHSAARSEFERLRLGTIQLLVAENARNNISDEETRRIPAAASSCGDGTDNCAGETYNEDEDAESSRYMQRLIDTVAGFNDERAIPALAGALCWGDRVTKPLLSLGDKALAPVLDQLKSRNSSLRMCSLDMVISLETPSQIVSQTRIRELIRSSLKDPDPTVRSSVVRAIDCRKDRQDFASLLQEVAKTDPFLLTADVPALDGGDGDKFFPVRADARKVLRHIKNNEPCGSEGLTIIGETSLLH